MQKIKKAVFPAAGLGTRFLPATKAQPKEMLPIVDKPVIQYLVEEAVASGIEEIVIVTGQGKRSIEDHFDRSFELEHTLKTRGKNTVLKEIKHLENLAKFIYVRQNEPLGDGHAILCAKHVVGNEPFAVLFGDDVIDSEVPATKQLMNVFYEKKASVMALQEVPKEKVSNYGVIEPDDCEGRLCKIKGLVEKPQPNEAPSNLAVVGKYICTPEIFDALEKVKPGKDGEIRLIDGFDILKERQALYGYAFEGKRYDTGDKLGFIKATIDFALKRPELETELLEYLQTIIKS